MTMKGIPSAIEVGSANDAAVAVAEVFVRLKSKFCSAAEMNRRAQELGMKNTVFSNASGMKPRTLGLDAEHHSSAYDLALLSRHAVQGSPT